MVRLGVSGLTPKTSTAFSYSSSHHGISSIARFVERTVETKNKANSAPHPLQFFRALRRSMRSGAALPPFWISS